MADEENNNGEDEEVEEENEEEESEEPASAQGSGEAKEDEAETSDSESKSSSTGGGAADEADDESEESPSTDPQDDSADEESDVDVPEKFEDIIESIEEMSVLELNELVETIEAKFGVEAAAMAAGGGGDDEKEEEKDAYDISLEDFGDNKIDVIKAVKAALGLGLKEAKDLVENVPSDLKSTVPKDEAEEMKEKIEEAGGTVELS